MGHARLVRDERSGIPLNKWINEVPNDGFIRYRLKYNKERVLVTSPKALAEILVQKNYDFTKPYKLRFGLGRILGVGLVIAEGEEHKKQRRRLLPAFQHRHIKNLYPVFWDKSVELSTTLPVNSANFSTTNITEWITRATLDIIGVAGMGHDFGAIQNPDNEASNAYRGVFESTPPSGKFRRLAMIVTSLLSLYVPIKRKDAIATASAKLKKIARKLIQQKQAIIDQSGKLSATDIISVAMTSGHFDEEGLANQILTFLAAGHETTATSMSWAILALCHHPEVQNRLRIEIRSNLPSPLNSEKASGITAELLDSLPYLHAVCNEVLRFYPPAGVTKRIPINNTTIMDQVIPKGIEVVISMRAINHSTALWGPDATEFNPERWIGPGKANSGGAENNFAYMTFLHEADNVASLAEMRLKMSQYKR
ncbi:MAG: hypothetical protein M1822_007086 [Bathelium mastoideum]|nr:MAG: hypothetical protein M1822_007086 [Bathelium mastoideum]